MPHFSNKHSEDIYELLRWEIQEGNMSYAQAVFSLSEVLNDFAEVLVTHEETNKHMAALRRIPDIPEDNLEKLLTPAKFDFTSAANSMMGGNPPSYVCECGHDIANHEDNTGSCGRCACMIFRRVEM